MKRILIAAGLTLFVVGCHQDMYRQPRGHTYAPSEFFDDGKLAQHPPEGTVSQGSLKLDSQLYEGTVDGEFATNFPEKVTLAMLERGRDRYNIYCSPCHGESGDGLGMIVQRGFKQPETFHQDRLRDAPVGYFFAIMEAGYLAANQLPEDDIEYVHPVLGKSLEASDRWAIVAYIRALQLSQHTPASQLTPEDLDHIANAGQEEEQDDEH